MGLLRTYFGLCTGDCKTVLESGFCPMCKHADEPEPGHVAKGDIVCPVAIEYALLDEFHLIDVLCDCSPELELVVCSNTKALLGASDE